MNADAQVRAARSPAWLSYVARLFLFSILLAGALVWGFVGGGFKTSLSGLACFQIDSVQINSEWPLVPSQVQSWLPSLKGQNLLLLRPSDLITQLSGKPWVDSVTIHKVFPSGLTIEVKTKRAVAVAILDGHAHFIDSAGLVIDRAAPNLLRALDLPIVAFRPEAKSSGWDLGEVVRVMQTFRFRMNEQADISEIVLEDRPYFRLFLSNPKMQVEFSLANWESQLPILALLLQSPPSQIDRPQSINLTLPKRAVVTMPHGTSSK